MKNNGTIFLAGPPLVKAATGEIVTSEELGGGDVHCRISGVTDHYAHNELHSLKICRNIFKTINHKTYLNQNLEGKQIESFEPLYDPEELNGIISDDLRRTFDVREVIARIVDSSK